MGRFTINMEVGVGHQDQDVSFIEVGESAELTCLFRDWHSGGSSRG